jgi:hypothetical protein
LMLWPRSINLSIIQSEDLWSWPSWFTACEVDGTTEKMRVFIFIFHLPPGSVFSILLTCKSNVTSWAGLRNYFLNIFILQFWYFLNVCTNSICSQILHFYLMKNTYSY